MQIIKATLVVLFAVAMPSIANAELKAVTVDDLLKREHIGVVVIDDERGFAYFERVNAAETWPGVLPYVNTWVMARARKSLHRVSLDGGEIEYLFPQEEGVGYYFSSADPWSPDERFIAFYRLSNGDLSIGVFNTVTSEHQLLDVDVHYPSSVYWSSNDTLMIAVSEAPAEDFTIVSGARANAYAQERVWQDRDVSVDVVGAGRYASAPDIDNAVSLLEINIRTGASREYALGTGRFSGVVTPQTRGSNFAVTHDAIADIAAPANAEFGSISRVTIIDRNTGASSIVDACDVRVVSWSSSGRYLLLVSRQLPGWWTDGHYKDLDFQDYERRVYSVFDNERGEIIGSLPKEAANPKWVGDHLAYNASSTGEPKSIGLETIQTITSSTPIIAASSDYYFTLEEGDLWRNDLRDARTKLSAVADEELALFAGRSAESKAQAGLPFLSSSADTPPLSSLVFKLGETSSGQYMLFSGDDHAPVVIAAPDPHAVLLAATEAGGVFLSRSNEYGGLLTYVRSGETAEPVNLYRFNEQLAEIALAIGPISLEHAGFDDRPVTSWLYLPPGVPLDGRAKFPLVVIAYAETVYPDDPRSRGSFRTAEPWLASLSTTNNMELFAARGYAVLIPSIPLPKRMDGPSDPMQQMMPAILSALDAALATGWVDEERLALTGQSYGGYTTLSVAVQTDRFDALIGQAVVSNLSSQFGQFSPSSRLDAASKRIPGGSQAEMAVTGQQRMGSTPASDPERYVRNSPLFFADQVTTPLMMIQGDLDATTFVTQAEEMYTALRREGKDVLFVRYFGEQHVIHHPQHQRDMWERVFAFLEDSGVMPGPKTFH